MDIVITFEVTPYEGNADDKVFIKLYSMELDGEIYTADESGSVYSCKNCLACRQKSTPPIL